MLNYDDDDDEADRSGTPTELFHQRKPDKAKRTNEAARRPAYPSGSAGIDIPEVESEEPSFKRMMKRAAETDLGSGSEKKRERSSQRTSVSLSAEEDMTSLQASLAGSQAGSLRPAGILDASGRQRQLLLQGLANDPALNVRSAQNQSALQDVASSRNIWGTTPAMSLGALGNAGAGGSLLGQSLTPELSQYLRLQALGLQNPVVGNLTSPAVLSALASAPHSNAAALGPLGAPSVDPYLGLRSPLSAALGQSSLETARQELLHSQLLGSTLGITSASATDPVTAAAAARAGVLPGAVNMPLGDLFGLGGLRLPRSGGLGPALGQSSLLGLTQHSGVATAVSGGIPASLPCTLAQPEDALKLSSHQVLLRHQIEAFQASDDDVSTHTRGRNKPITIGQVGIRCRHCAHLPVARRQKGSTYFPATLLGLYQAAQNMSTTHMQCGLCTEMPEAIKQEFVHLLSSKVASSGAGRPYWAQSAKKIGLVDTEEGIRFIRDLPPGASINTEVFDTSSR